MPRNFGNEADSSVIARPYIAKHLTKDAIMIADRALVATFVIPPVTFVGSEHLLQGFRDSPTALGRLQQFGISRDALELADSRFEKTEERELGKTGESLEYRAIFSLAALLAAAEQNTNDYQIDGGHLVAAVRRFPQTRLYKILEPFAQKTDF
jgi:hypothetical protein